MSFQLCKELINRQAFFIFRVKENLIYTVTETLNFSMPDSTISVFDSISDEVIRYENNQSKATYRLVRFAVNQENYFNGVVN